MLMSTPQRRNPQIVTSEGFGGRTPVLRPLMLGSIVTLHYLLLQVFSNQYQSETLRLTRSTAAGRKLAQKIAAMLLFVPASLDGTEA